MCVSGTYKGPEARVAPEPCVHHIYTQLPSHVGKHEIALSLLTKLPVRRNSIEIIWRIGPSGPHQHWTRAEFYQVQTVWRMCANPGNAAEWGHGVQGHELIPTSSQTVGSTGGPPWGNDKTSCWGGSREASVCGQGQARNPGNRRKNLSQRQAGRNAGVNKIFFFKKVGGT